MEVGEHLFAVLPLLLLVNHTRYTVCNTFAFDSIANMAAAVTPGHPTMYAEKFAAEGDVLSGEYANILVCFCLLS